MDRWPALALASWEDTYATLHMWTQMAGKVCLALTPRSNHFWNIAFQVTPRGLTTPSLPGATGAFTIAFDFVSHQLVIQYSDGRCMMLPLESQTVADFYARFVSALHGLGEDVHIWPMPVEIPDPIRFDADTTHRTYQPEYANAVWRIMLASKQVLERFRCDFIGKCSPVHFFWGSFDLAVTRFSGRRAPERQGADAMMREAYSHEVISHGFWPGRRAVSEACFYAYAAPEPAGFKETLVRPAAAAYRADLGEFILPYEAVRTAPSPEAALTEFLESTYDSAADLAKWNRDELERR